MITLFRRVREKLIGEGNVRRYLLYAVGEIALVMIGILLALQVNNWNEGRKLQQKEFSYLNRLYEEVQRDSISLSSSIKLTGSKIEQTKRVLDHIQKQIPLSDSAQFIGEVFLIGRGGSFRPYLPAYEELISTGDLGIIQNKTVTELLARYIKRVEGWESFIYQEGEKRRSAYMEHIHTYFSAMIMNYIWDNYTY